MRTLPMVVISLFRNFRDSESRQPKTHRSSKRYSPGLILSFSLALGFPGTNNLNAQSHTLETDSLALVDFYNELNGQDWGALGDGWLTDPIADWHGIEITDGRVSSLIFSECSDTQVHGALPSSFGNLDRLTVFWISNNGITSLPNEFNQLESLEIFGLDTPRLTDPMPDIFQGMESLRRLSWTGNQNMTGPLPSSLFNLSSLESLQLSDIQLSSFPTEFLQLTDLRILGLNNSLGDGSIDSFFSVIARHDSLKYLHISEIKEERTIPRQLFQIANLQWLQLNSSNWTGSIPEEIGQLTKLQRLYISETLLSGPLPTSIGNLPELKQLYLVDTAFSGDLPQELSNLNKLKTVYIGDTELSGSLAPLFSSVETLSSISISGNEFNGPIPASIQDMTNLKRLNLENNKLESQISINFAALDSLDIDRCQLAGNQSSLCIEDTPDNRAINNDGFCGIAFCSPSVSTESSAVPDPLFNIQIYPNPVRGRINVIAQNNDIETIKVFDINGRLQANSAYSFNTQIDLSSLPSGTYFLRATNRTGSVSSKSFALINPN